MLNRRQFTKGLVASAAVVVFPAVIERPKVYQAKDVYIEINGKSWKVSTVVGAMWKSKSPHIVI